MRKFPHYHQSESKDCGPTCLKIVAKYHGRTLDIEQLRLMTETTREGSSLLGLSQAAENLGFRAIAARIKLQQLKEAPLPCIVHWDQEHFVVVYGWKKDKVFISDPAQGLVSMNTDELQKHWGEGYGSGVVLLLEATPKFYHQHKIQSKEPDYDLSFISSYLLRYRKFLVQLLLGLAGGSLFQLIIPFLTQSIVDVGIQFRNLNFIYLVLAAQLFLFFGRTGLEIIRGWILLHLSTRINISLVSDFFIKLMRLPIAYFDTKMTGDLLQRINDHSRIEKILTVSSLNVLFSSANLLVFSAVLAYYNLQIFSIFLLGSAGYLLWVLFFFKKRKEIDHLRFAEISNEQSKVIELINGMQEIKLHNAEQRMRWNWELIQARLFNVNIKTLTLEQTQNVGSSFINELKNILITILSAKLVIDGDITLGMMLAISYIVGQLNNPISQWITFLRDLQDAKISLQRLNEIHHKAEEDQGLITTQNIPIDQPIRLKNLTFRYVGGFDPVIKDLDMIIPAGQTTAVVGASGSGKTTLLKLLLNFYQPQQGEVRLGNLALKNITQKQWRQQIGVVMQEGYIFNDTIARNIAISSEYPDPEKLRKAATLANILEYIEDTPLGFQTRIGMEGTGLSTGQKQRILIARAVYKDPKIVFMDEATSALDAHNEKIIIENLKSFLSNKTAVVIAHRLSTVVHAHKIIVMQEGQIVEEGNHETLTAHKGVYYSLVKNQLELG